jgi:hypothetical protein
MPKVECKYCHKKFKSQGVKRHEHFCSQGFDVATEPIQKPNAAQQLHDAIQTVWSQCTLSEQIRAILFLREGE